MRIAMSQQIEPTQSGADPTVVLLLTLADTTWRMLVPTGLLAALGLWVDLHYATAPWLTLASVPVGLAVSVLLVRRQLRSVR
jgi:hypothetical protein